MLSRKWSLHRIGWATWVIIPRKWSLGEMGTKKVRIWGETTLNRKMPIYGNDWHSVGKSRGREARDIHYQRDKKE